MNPFKVFTAPGRMSILGVFVLSLFLFGSPTGLATYSSESPNPQVWSKYDWKQAFNRFDVCRKATNNNFTRCFPSLQTPHMTRLLASTPVNTTPQPRGKKQVYVVKQVPVPYEVDPIIHVVVVPGATQPSRPNPAPAPASHPTPLPVSTPTPVPTATPTPRPTPIPTPRPTGTPTPSSTPPPGAPTLNINPAWSSSQVDSYCAPFLAQYDSQPTIANWISKTCEDAKTAADKRAG